MPFVTVVTHTEPNLEAWRTEYFASLGSSSYFLMAVAAWPA